MSVEKYKIDHVLFYLRTPRSRKEIEHMFELSNTESFHLVKILKKWGDIKEPEILAVNNHTNRVWYYETKAEFKPRYIYSSEVIIHDNYKRDDCDSN
jgi:hypothetical protein